MRRRKVGLQMLAALNTNFDAKLLRKLQAQGKKHNVFDIVIITLKSINIYYIFNLWMIDTALSF